MGYRSDFAVIKFNEHLGNNANDLNYDGTTFVGNQTTIRTFNLGDQPTGEAYFTLQLYDVQAEGHHVLINGKRTGGIIKDIPKNLEYKWFIWTNTIEKGIIQKGNNTIQIKRNSGSGDNFIVGSVIISWREKSP
jgi:hypothetical protein